MTCLRIASHALRAFAPLALVTSILSAADLHAARVACGTGIGTCTAPSCDGSTPRVVSTMQNTAFPIFGNVPGGFEVVVAEGFTHLDVLTAEDNADNPVVSALAAFLARNAL
jgi:hypothetical protein